MQRNASDVTVSLGDGEPKLRLTVTLDPKDDLTLVKKRPDQGLVPYSSFAGQSSN